MTLTKKTISISGMHCEGCVGLLSDVLSDIDGVKEAKVSLEHKSAEVVFDSGKTNEQSLRLAIHNEGYETK